MVWIVEINRFHMFFKQISIEAQRTELTMTEPGWGLKLGPLGLGNRLRICQTQKATPWNLLNRYRIIWNKASFLVSWILGWPVLSSSKSNMKPPQTWGVLSCEGWLLRPVQRSFWTLSLEFWRPLGVKEEIWRWKGMASYCSKSLTFKTWVSNYSISEPCALSPGVSFGFYFYLGLLDTSFAWSWHGGFEIRLQASRFLACLPPNPISLKGGNWWPTVRWVSLGELKDSGTSQTARRWVTRDLRAWGPLLGFLLGIANGETEAIVIFQTPLTLFSGGQNLKLTEVKKAWRFFLFVCHGYYKNWSIRCFTEFYHKVFGCIYQPACASLRRLETKPWNKLTVMMKTRPMKSPEKSPFNTTVIMRKTGSTTNLPSCFRLLECVPMEKLQVWRVLAFSFQVLL